MRLIDEFMQTASDNVERLLKAKDEARRSAVRREDGGYGFTVTGFNGNTETKMFVEVSAENISSVIENNLHVTFQEAVDEKAKKMAILAQMTGADMQEKFSRYKALSDDERKIVEDRAEQTKVQFRHEAEAALLVDQIVAPVIANRATQIAYQTAHAFGVMNGNPAIVPEKDHGYCTKALTHTLYEMKFRYGGFEFLPENAEDAAHPMDFVRHLQEQPLTAKNVHKTPEGVSLREEIRKYPAGALAVLDQGEGRFHTMLYTGKTENGNPVFISFNNDDAALQLRNPNKTGYIIDLPSVLAAEESRRPQSERPAGNAAATENSPSSRSQNGRTEEKVAIAGGYRVKLDIHRRIADLRAEMEKRIVSEKDKEQENKTERGVPSPLKESSRPLDLISHVNVR